MFQSKSVWLFFAVFFCFVLITFSYDFSNIRTIQNTFMPNELLALQLDIMTDFSSDDMNRDFWFIDSVDQFDSPSRFEITLSGKFSTPTIGYLYVSIPLLDCASKTPNCLYPGTLFPFDIPSWTSKVVMNDLNIRESFRTFQDSFDQESKIYPPSFSIDILIPLNNYIELNTSTTYNISMSICSLRHPSTQAYSFSRQYTAPTRPNGGSTSSINSSTYTGWGSALKSIAYGANNYGLKFDLKTKSRGDFSPTFSSDVNFIVLPLSRLQRLDLKNRSSKCNLSASRIDKFFWGVNVGDLGKMTLSWAFDPFPASININCSEQFSQHSPAHFYLYRPHTGLIIYRYSEVTSSIYKVVSQAVLPDHSIPINHEDVINKFLITPYAPLYALQVDNNLPVELSSRFVPVSDSSISTGAIIGIVIGSVAGLFLITFIIICCVCNQNAAKSTPIVPTVGNSKRVPLNQAVQVATYSSAPYTPTQSYPSQTAAQSQLQCLYPDPGQHNPYQQQQQQQQYNPTVQPQQPHPYTQSTPQSYYEAPPYNHKGGDIPPSYDAL